MNSEIQLAAIALISALALAFGHYFDWRSLLDRDLPRVAAYIYGTLCVNAPFSVFLYLNGYSELIISQWAVIVASGGAVMFCHALDSWMRERRGRIEAEERERHALARAYDQGPAGS